METAGAHQKISHSLVAVPHATAAAGPQEEQ